MAAFALFRQRRHEEAAAKEEEDSEEDESIEKEIGKRKTEFIEREDAKMATFERASGGATTKSSTTTEDGASSSKSSSSSSSILEEKSFEAKLKRVREEGEMRAKMTAWTGGRRRPHHRRRHSGAHRR